MSIIQKILSLLGLGAQQNSNGAELKAKELNLEKIREQRSGNFPVLKDWVIDYAHSAIKFRVMHMGIVEVLGKFKDWNAKFQGTSPVFNDIKTQITIQVNSIETDFLARDMHLKSPDFFDVEKYPTIQFESTKISWRPLRFFTIEGNLTMKGITKPVKLEGQLKNFIPKDLFGFPRVGFTVSTQINRKDWGLSWSIELESGDLVVDELVKIEADIEITTPQCVEAMQAFLKQMQAQS